MAARVTPLAHANHLRMPRSDAFLPHTVIRRANLGPDTATVSSGCSGTTGRAARRHTGLASWAGPPAAAAPPASVSSSWRPRFSGISEMWYAARSELETRARRAPKWGRTLPCPRGGGRLGGLCRSPSSQSPREGSAEPVQVALPTRKPSQTGFLEPDRSGATPNARRARRGCASVSDRSGPPLPDGTPRGRGP